MRPAEFCHVPFGKRRVAPLAGVVFLFLLALLAGCGTEAPADWQWWTSADSAAVRSELAGWRGALNANQALTDTLRLNLRSRIAPADTSSLTGTTVYKFARLLAVWPVPGESGHVDGFTFGVTVDTLVLQDSVMGDTFCQVDYYDRMWSGVENGGQDTVPVLWTFRYDSLWVVTFRPETVVSGPDTSVLWHPDQVTLQGFAEPRETTKAGLWSPRRALFLHKVDSTEGYRLRKTTGFAAFAPSTEAAPSIDKAVLNRPGRSDTIFYSPRRDGRGLYNLRPLDSLQTVEQDEVIDLVVTTSTPADTNTDRNRFFLGIAGRKTEITAGAKTGRGSFSFADTGYQHVYVDVLPHSNLLYKEAAFKGLTWAIPVLVRQRP